MSPTHNPDNRNENRSNGYPSNDRGAPPRDDRGPPSDDGPLLPEGDYAVRAKKHRWGWTNGKPSYEQIGILLVIVEGPHQGKSLLYYGNFHPNSAEITVKALRSLGWVGEDPNKMDSIYQGAPCTAVVEHDTYEGKKRAKVKWLNSSDVVMKNEMDPNEVKVFGTRMRALFRQIPGSSSASKSAPPDDRSQGNGQQQPAGRDADFGGYGGGQQQRQQEQRSFGDQRGGGDQRGNGRDYPPDDRNVPPPNDPPPWGDRGR